MRLNTLSLEQSVNKKEMQQILTLSWLKLQIQVHVQKKEKILTLSWLRLQVQVPWSASLAAATSSLHSLLFPEQNL